MMKTGVYIAVLSCSASGSADGASDVRVRAQSVATPYGYGVAADCAPCAACAGAAAGRALAAETCGFREQARNGRVCDTHCLI